MPSREGYDLIAEHYPPGEIAPPIQVIVDTEGNDMLLKENLTALPIVESVSDPQTGEQNPDMQQYEVTLSINPYSEEAVEKIPKLQSAVESTLKEAGIADAEEHYLIGGETANLYDTEEVTSSDQNIVIPVVLIIIAAMLIFYLRSIVAMGYLLLTVGLSYLSALGLGWLIIHYGLGADSMQGLIPLYAFVFLVALGGDYNIFMISSIWRNRKQMPP
ncbi:membrane protein [Gracilibacillus boraciitolerans JCM 21714]|uniref:Membrane protein n=1 Tax=Gracilibacillus boraciitolerans JCM 21714 TaxID=1298598 RepID=W4VPY7_9BACI|nr:membrane protein [Gracilibacillus boraciitolerans JCM 21714]